MRVDVTDRGALYYRNAGSIPFVTETNEWIETISRRIELRAKFNYRGSGIRSDLDSPVDIFYA